MAQITHIGSSQRRPPKHLKASGRALWKAILGDFELENHHLVILQTAAEALDRLQEAREVIDKVGLIIKDAKGGFRTNPAIAIERDSRLAVLRALRELSLDTDAVEQYARPPRIAGRYRG